MVTPDNWWTSWVVEPLVIAALSLATAAWLAGLRTTPGAERPGRWRRAAFLAGILALAVALEGPLDEMGGELFSAHMGQHLLLIAVAAPLLALAEPLPAFVNAIPAGWRRAVAGGRSSPDSALRTLRRPPVVWVLLTVTWWGWHVPPAYEATLRSETIHGLEHLSFLATAFLFWSVVLRPQGSRGGFSAPVLVIAAAAQNTALGAVITLSQSSWYASYAGSTQAWGFTPLHDQQLAGALMWIPMDLVLLLTAATLFILWIQGMEPELSQGPVAGAGRPPVGGG